VSRGDSSIDVSASYASEGNEHPLNLQDLIRDGHSFSARERHCCFLNTGGPRFADVSAVSGLDFPDDGRAAARVDWDQDGDLDLWISNRNGPQVRLLRNDRANRHHYLAVRLEGRTCNRDAIGARLELTLDEPGKPTIIKTVHGGDGFLAQSSKRIHFGVGKATRLDRLVVRWPGGDVEEFRRLLVDRAYVIVQGRGRAEMEPARTQRLALATSRLEGAPSTDAAQVFLASRVPLPRLRYKTLDGQPRVLAPADGRPLLVNLWATWCQPCVAELSEFTARSQQIRDAGIDVVAVSVDELHEQEAADSDGNLLGSTSRTFPFTMGKALAELVIKLQIIHNELFDRHTILDLPTSVLIDGNGDLAAIYKGPVSVDRLLADVANLGLPPERTHEASVPFPGRQMMEPAQIPLVPIFRELLRREFRDDAIEFMVRNRKRFPASVASADLLVSEASKLLDEGKLPAAEQRLRQAIVVDDNHALAHAQLGRVLSRLHRNAEAEAEFVKSLAIDPDNSTSHFAFALLLKENGRASEAIPHLRKVVELRPDHVPTLYHLAQILASDPNSDNRNGPDAVRLAEKAAQITNYRQADILAVLAAAYAQVGRFPDAATAAERAIEISKLNGNAALTLQLDQQLKAYRRSNK
jgi:tetratricopeptide (TPR) repeat protein